MAAGNSCLTKRGRVLLNELCEHNGHPTAEELYRRITDYMPKISLATVYRVLDALVQGGTVVRLDQASGGLAHRYDADIRPHAHIRCVSCGKVWNADSWIPRVVQEFHPKKTPPGFEIHGVRVSYVGLCGACQDERE